MTPSDIQPAPDGASSPAELRNAVRSVVAGIVTRSLSRETLIVATRQALSNKTSVNLSSEADLLIHQVVEEFLSDEKQADSAEGDTPPVPADRPSPAPADEAAYRGLAGDFVRAI